MNDSSYSIPNLFNLVSHHLPTEQAGIKLAGSGLPPYNLLTDASLAALQNDGKSRSMPV
jgi:hypothetical protein